MISQLPDKRIWDPGLSSLSARIPPRGDSTMGERVAAYKSPPNTADEPVTSNPYIDNARFRIKFPNMDVSCPKKKDNLQKYQ